MLSPEITFSTARDTPFLGRAQHLPALAQPHVSSHRRTTLLLASFAVCLMLRQGKEIPMPPVQAPIFQSAWWQKWGSPLLLVALLLLELGVSFVLAANTPWVLDQPTQPYDWMNR